MIYRPCCLEVVVGRPNVNQRAAARWLSCNEGIDVVPRLTTRASTGFVSCATGEPALALPAVSLASGQLLAVDRCAPGRVDRGYPHGSLPEIVFS